MAAQRRSARRSARISLSDRGPSGRAGRRPGDLQSHGRLGGDGGYQLARRRAPTAAPALTISPNTAGVGGTLTGFAQGSGSVTADRIYVGGVEFGGGGGTGVMNINTTGTVTANFRLIVGEQGTGTVNLDSGTINIANDLTVGFRTNGANTWKRNLPYERRHGQPHGRLDHFRSGRR